MELQFRNREDLVAQKEQMGKPLAIEPFDRDWGTAISSVDHQPSPFPRINRILAVTEPTTNGTIEMQRAMIVTRVYKETEALPQILRCAKALEAIVSEVPCVVQDDELIVGGLGCPNNGAPVFPEFGIGWLVEEMETGLLGYSEQRTHDYFTHTQEDYENCKKIYEEYWKGKSVFDRAWSDATDDMTKGDIKGCYGTIVHSGCGPGHTSPSFTKLFRLGYGGIRKTIEAELEKLDELDPDSVERKYFLEACLITNHAASIWFNRWGDAADAKAAEETDPIRRMELKQIAENCHHLATEPPETFWQGVQMVHLAVCLVHLESNGHSINYGRFDQYMYPLFKKDIENGTGSREFAQELMENLHIKIWNLNKLRDHIAVSILGNGGIGGPAMTVGGVDAEGNDATNELTFMFMDALAHTRIPCPWASLRLHSGTPWEVKVKLYNTIKLGMGEPKIFNDDCIVPSMLSLGKTLEDARDYQCCGCVEPDITGKEYGGHGSGDVNLAKCIELALNNGQCYVCSDQCPRYAVCAGAGKSLGPRTGKVSEMNSFDEVLKAAKEQIHYWSNKDIAFLNIIDKAHAALKPLPYLSMTQEGPIENGKDVTAGGAIYSGLSAQGVGLGSAADALSTVKQLVFEEKKVTMDELLAAVRADWEGYEGLYQLVNSDYVHHYGNDDDYADELAQFVFDSFVECYEGRPAPHGGTYLPGIYSVTANVAYGRGMAGGIEGRKAGEPVSDNMGAVHTRCASHDVNGPTAFCNSVTKLNHMRATNGTLTNWKFSPATLIGDAGRDAWISLIDQYIHQKGLHGQFTVASKEVLEDAQRRPDDYKDLLVRVAGYSAYFVELNKDVQDDIIGRTELAF